MAFYEKLGVTSTKNVKRIISEPAFNAFGITDDIHHYANSYSRKYKYKKHSGLTDADRVHSMKCNIYLSSFVSLIRKTIVNQKLEIETRTNEVNEIIKII